MKSPHSLLICLVLFMPHWSSAQKPSVKKLAVTWEVKPHASANNAATDVVFTLSNHSNKPLLAKGWSLFFNSRIHLVSREGKLRVDHINGDLYRATCVEGIDALEKDESVRGYLTSEKPFRNNSDAPRGFYLVWDDKPDVGIPLESFSFIPYITGTSEPGNVEANEQRFLRNSVIDELEDQSLVKIFPTPFAYEERSGLFMITELTSIETDPGFEEIGEYLAEELVFYLGASPGLNPKPGDGRNRIILRKGNARPEEYTLSVNPARIEITSSSPAGAFYAIQSLKTMIQPSALKSVQRFVAVPSVEVMDRPHFAYRGLLLDVARNFQTKQQVLKIIDVMALYKLNVLHLHLTDDEGWRLEIRGLPELTETGSRRGHHPDRERYLSPAFGSGPDWQNSSANGYYSRQDFIDILRYAKLNFVTVIPEVAMPSHSHAAIVSMNHRYHKLMEDGKSAEANEFLLGALHATSANVNEAVSGNMMDPGLPSTFRFIEKVVDEIVTIYKEARVPLVALHVGGNDVSSTAWQGREEALLQLDGDPDIQDSDDLMRYFFRRVHRILKSRNVALYGWQDVGTSIRDRTKDDSFSPDPEFAHCNVFVDLYQSQSPEEYDRLARRMANAGYKVVLTPSPDFDFDVPYEDVYDEPGQSYGYADINRSFGFRMETNPGKTNELVSLAGYRERKHDNPLTDYGISNIVGIKGVLWTQTVATASELEYMLLPRLLALAERAWSQSPSWSGDMVTGSSRKAFAEDWSHFLHVLGKRELPRLDWYRGGYRYRIPAPGIKVEGGELKANIQFPGLILRYTTDGKAPTSRSPLYTGDIPATEGVKVRAFNSTGRGGRTAIWKSTLPLPEYSPEDQDEDDAAYTHK